MTAQARRRSLAAANMTASRHAMVRRLRPRPLDAEGQGRAACLRALDRLGEPDRRCRSAPHRPQQRSARQRQDRMRTAPPSSMPASPRARSGLAPALVVASDADDDYGFIDISAGGLRSHRSRRRRARSAGAGGCLRLCRARRLSPRRDGPCRGAAARRAMPMQLPVCRSRSSSSGRTASNIRRTAR